MSEIAYMCRKANMKPDEVLEMDIGMFLGLRKEFFIMDLQSTEEGRQKLKDAERMTQKKADINGVKSLMNKLGK